MMNAYTEQPRPRSRRLKPFDLEAIADSLTTSSRILHAVRREVLKRRADPTACYGCVDWYVYPDEESGVAGGSRADIDDHSR